MFYIELVIIFAIAVLISVPLGKYMYKIFSFEKIPGKSFLVVLRILFTGFAV